jgi:hypothetical protein
METYNVNLHSQVPSSVNERGYKQDFLVILSFKSRWLKKNKEVIINLIIMALSVDLYTVGRTPWT